MMFFGSMAQESTAACQYSAGERFSKRFEGKVAVITASTKGIGLDTARRFALEGAKVVICSRKQTNVDEAVRTLHNEGLNVTGLVCHAAKKDDREKLLNEAEKLGGIDILVANAAVNPVPGPIFECTESVWDKIFDTNLKSTFFLIKESLPLIKKRQGGSIILMASHAAYDPISKIGIYGVSKTALLGLTKTMANELAEYNIRVNCVAPGYVDTDFVQIVVIAFLASKDADYITGEIVIMTGGWSSRLIGLDTARRFAQEGAKVVISSRKQKNVDEALKTLNNEGLDVKGLVCHVAKKDDRDKLLNEAEKLGGIDVLVMNAAVNPVPGPAVECNEGVWDKIFDTNLKSTFFLAKESLPLMQKRQGGSIIIMSSQSAYVPVRKIGIYGISKTALLGLTKTMADELAEYNIRVNCVAPGYVDTTFVQILLEDMTKVLSRIPMGRIGGPRDVSGVIAFLASKDAGYITGETILITGGMTSRL
ncbi:hypothetical protein RI129_004263 [Pyrocoelia pectoralis]|uniref:Dehydrogenase/reductase SDR family member 4 n=1 Tax=Pyrocoelia pectoralis TaxID=417401 RepID=A0AAN7VL33_9COLE